MSLRKTPLAAQFRCKGKTIFRIPLMKFPIDILLFILILKKKNCLEPFRDKFTYYIDKDPVIWLEYCRYGVKHKSINQQNELESTDVVNSLTKKEL